MEASEESKQDDPQGIMVFTEDTASGIQVGFHLVGGFPPLSAPTVLELAAKAARQQLGLE